MHDTWTKAAVWMAALGALVAGCGSDASTSSVTSTESAPVATSGPAATSPGVEDVDYVYQTRVDDPGVPGGDDGIGVFVSIEGQVRRVDGEAPGGRHKHPVWTNDGSQVTFVAEAEWDARGAVVRGSEVWVVDPTGGDATS